MSDFKILVLISGKGSNLISLHEHADRYNISAVISNNPTAEGLLYAKKHKIPVYPFSRSDFSSMSTFKDAIYQKVLQLKPDLVVLAGFMQIIQPQFVEAFYGRMINIHPALLPKFPGLDTHTRAIAAKEPTHGCTVHFVNTGIDSGPIIAQAECALSVEDTPESAAAKVLKEEHRVYPWVVKNIATGDISLVEDKVLYSPDLRRDAALKGFKIG